MIDFEHVSKKYKHGGSMALDDVSFHINKGEFVFLLGRSGAGKSTLLKLILREEKATSGRVLVNLVKKGDVARLRRHQVPYLRRQMGIIFQDFQLLHDRTVVRNLHFVLRATGWRDEAAISKRIGEVLDAVGMADKADRMPHELSGGEQQRVAIARALLNKPKVIIADEPTGNLDPETAARIVQILQDATKDGTTVIMSTHNINLLDQFPGKVYQCEDGKLLEIGE